MDKTEALKILELELSKFRTKSYTELEKMIEESPATKKIGIENGKNLYLEFNAHWDDKPNGNIRFGGCIDDGGWRAFCPLTRDFILSPSGEFVDE